MVPSDPKTSVVTTHASEASTVSEKDRGSQATAEPRPQAVTTEDQSPLWSLAQVACGNDKKAPPPNSVPATQASFANRIPSTDGEAPPARLFEPNAATRSLLPPQMFGPQYPFVPTAPARGYAMPPMGFGGPPLVTQDWQIDAVQAQKDFSVLKPILEDDRRWYAAFGLWQQHQNRQRFQQAQAAASMAAAAAAESAAAAMPGSTLSSAAVPADATEANGTKKAVKLGAAKLLPVKKGTTAKSDRNNRSKPKLPIMYFSAADPKMVLCGRGGRTNFHPGNVRFRNRCHALRDEYNKLKKNEKPAYTMAIIKEVHQWGGRFLAKEEDGPKGEERWYEIDDGQARYKVSQEMRERRKRDPSAYEQEEEEEEETAAAE